jgi:hypothetical protein
MMPGRVDSVATFLVTSSHFCARVSAARNTFRAYRTRLDVVPSCCSW